MTILTSEQIEQVITQAHADVLAYANGTAPERDTDRAIVGALRVVYTLGHDQGTAETIKRAVELLGSPIAEAQHEQLAHSMATIVQWCDEGDVSLECRSYSVRRTVYTDPERKYSATGGSIADAYPVQHFGASHAEALARLATWCAERLVHDGKTETNNAVPVQS